MFSFLKAKIEGVIAAIVETHKKFALQFFEDIIIVQRKNNLNINFIFTKTRSFFYKKINFQILFENQAWMYVFVVRSPSPLFQQCFPKQPLRADMKDSFSLDL